MRAYSRGNCARSATTGPAAPAAIINAQAPDALAVQELGDPEALDDLVARLSGNWHGRIWSHPDRRGIRVAWLTRSPITAATDIVKFPPPLAPVQSDDRVRDVQGGFQPSTSKSLFGKVSEPTEHHCAAR
jgi:hypothetical protein